MAVIFGKALLRGEATDDLNLTWIIRKYFLNCFCQRFVKLASETFKFGLTKILLNLNKQSKNSVNSIKTANASETHPALSHTPA